MLPKSWVIKRKRQVTVWTLEMFEGGKRAYNLPLKPQSAQPDSNHRESQSQTCGSEPRWHFPSRIWGRPGGLCGWRTPCRTTTPAASPALEQTTTDRRLLTRPSWPSSAVLWGWGRDRRLGRKFRIIPVQTPSLNGLGRRRTNKRTPQQCPGKERKLWEGKWPAFLD